MLIVVCCVIILWVARADYNSVETSFGNIFSALTGHPSLNLLTPCHLESKCEMLSPLGDNNQGHVKYQRLQ